MASDSLPMKNDLEKEAVTPDSDSDSFQVSLDENEDPQHMATWRKWAAMIVLSAGALCVTCLSSIVHQTFQCCHSLLNFD